MSATVHYVCDRCGRPGTVPGIEGQPAGLPDTGWARMGLEDRPVLHLCPTCRPALDDWLAEHDPVPEPGIEDAEVTA